MHLISRLMAFGVVCGMAGLLSNSDLVAIARTAPSQAPIGALFCSPDPLQKSQPAGEAQQMVCTFEGEGMPSERYIGAVSTNVAGNDPLERALLFVVRTPREKSARVGFLEQEYAGSGAPERPGAPQTLTGQDDSDVVLQMEGGQSPTFAVGKISLKLYSIMI